ncbi:MAG TPA: tRNA pseudouridine(55) synthase TruB [Nitrososphaera sp.]|nr:tRNA pseudouridine(55) synthase TruB [Nitrososphaera sp.]
MLAGVLNINKPLDWTSFKVVDFVRKKLGLRKVGHAGTLDPLATGVLLVLLNRATRISEYLMELSKTYRAEIHFGIATSTYDATGVPTYFGDNRSLNEAILKAMLEEFTGEIEQVPPLYSAVKVRGKAAYELARKNEPFELKPRRVKISRLELLDYTDPVAIVEVECGKGTYLRSLAHDLGQRLGCGAHLRALTRLRVGQFTIEESETVDDLELRLGNLNSLPLLSMNDALSHLPAVILSDLAAKIVYHGGSIKVDSSHVKNLASRPEDDTLSRLIDEKGCLLAIGRFNAVIDVWKPEKVLI